MFLQNIPEGHEIQRPGVGKEIQEHGVEMMLITVTYTQLNSKVEGQLSVD